MTDTTALHAAIVETLSAEDSPLRARLMEIQIDHALSRPVRELIDVGELVEIIQTGMTEANVERLIVRHLRPGRERIRVRWEASGETPRDLLPADAISRLEAMATSGGGPRGRWARDAVDPALIRRLFAPVFQELLLGFVKRVVSTLPGVDGDERADKQSSSKRPFGSGFGLRSKLKKTVGKRAEQIAGAGKSVLDGLGMDLEGRMKKVAREFSQTASGTMRDAMKARLKSDEGQEILAEMKLQLLRRFLDTPMSELSEDAARADDDGLREVVIAAAGHNARRAPFEEGLRAEVEAWMAEEGDRAMKELLEEAGTYELVREALLARAGVIGASFFEGEGFGEWLGEVLAVAAAPPQE